MNAHQARHVDGRYKLMYRCDACGQPIGDRGCTDDEVCQGDDGPGFYLCSRKKCVATYAGKTVAERRKLYKRRET